MQMEMDLDGGLAERGTGRDRLLLIDGMAILFRAYFATSFTGSIRRTSSGMPVNAVHGFVRYFWDAVKRFEPSHIVCCWDMGSKTFRSDQFAHYKANRPEAPLDLIPQFELVKDVVASFGIPNVGLAGYEADDCIGTLARAHSEATDVYVLTGDQDLLQLVSDTVTVAIMKKGHGNYALYTPDYLMEERGLRPAQIIDVKGLMGDASDNYPGVKGIGEKTALKLILEYGSIDGILERLAELPATVRAKIENDLEMLELSRQLARIHCEVPLSLALDSCCWTLDRPRVAAKFEELEFGGLLKLIG